MSSVTDSLSRRSVKAFSNANQLRDSLSLLPKPKYGRLVAKASDRLTSELKRNGKLLKVEFELRDYDYDLHACHQHACDALEVLAFQHAPSRFYHATDVYTQDGLPKGVSLGIGNDIRSDGKYPHWRVQVHWHNGRRSTNKTFRIGRIDLVDQAMIDDVCRVASEFRRAYDRARLNREPFDPSPWREWRALLTEETQEACHRHRALLKQQRTADTRKPSVR